MTKWLIMTVLCLSLAGCGWFKSDDDADANAGDTAESAATEGSDDNEGEKTGDDK